ncbi:MAG: hypothetical protein Q8Q09_29420 [Deltaproteobacteria bacterium]|nr:hypothetical protein [Deltaproteobacteria bacterium]
MRRWLLLSSVALSLGCAEDLGGPGDGSNVDVVSDVVASGEAGGGGGDAGLDASFGSDGGGVIGSDAGGDGSGGSDATVPDGSMVMLDDADMDGISDVDEGRAAGVDTDRDGVPDYLDSDSDDDGIPDREEAGDTFTVTPPVDSDRDGTPDFRDLDSDGNGWPDRLEGAMDRDADGLGDYRDMDNDGDFIDDMIEIGPMPMTPVDTDRDGIADLNEVDADNDTILDAEESATTDTDRDGRVDRVDDDSDNDTWTDREEAGDLDLATPAVDTDMDGIPDYRDPDSDNDGLSDRLERTHRTSRTNPDTDGDGVSDLIEVGAGTNPLDMADSPRTRGNFVFVVPYMMPPMPARDTLQFSTTLRRADVYFLMDTTGSMGGEIANLRNGINGTLIPDIRRRIPEAWMAVGRYDDYPVAPYGAGADRPYVHMQDLTMTDTDVSRAVNLLGTNNGADVPESGLQAMYGVATGLSIGTGSVGRAGACPMGRTGYPCFRPDAVPIIVNFTDAPFHNGPGGANPYSGAVTSLNYTTISAALASRGIRVMTVNSGGVANRAHHEALANATNATDAGRPLVYDIGGDGSGLTTAVVTGIEALARQPLDVSVQGRDLVDPGESVDAMAAFVDHLETRVTPAPGRICTVYPTVDRPGIDTDAFPDTFVGVRGQPVCFDIIAKTNMTVRPTLVPQLFRAQLDVIGNGFTPLDNRVVYFLVPPTVPDPN